MPTQGKVKTGKQARRRNVGRPRGTGVQTVYEVVRQDILQLRRRPGETLDEGSLEREFKVSRTPVREALIRLASEGLVQMMPNRGANVAYLDVSDVPQLFEALELFQRVAYRWCALRQNPAAIKKLRQHNVVFAAASLQMDIEKMGMANHLFHMAIGEGSGNIFVSKTYETLLNDSLRLATTLFSAAAKTDRSAGYFRQIVDEHQETIEAIEHGDADKAERLAVDHTHLFRKEVLAFMQRSRSSDTTVSDPVIA